MKNVCKKCLKILQKSRMAVAPVESARYKFLSTKKATWRQHLLHLYQYGTKTTSIKNKWFKLSTWGRIFDNILVLYNAAWRQHLSCMWHKDTPNGNKWEEYNFLSTRKGHGSTFISEGQRNQYGSPQMKNLWIFVIKKTDTLVLKRVAWRQHLLYPQSTWTVNTPAKNTWVKNLIGTANIIVLQKAAWQQHLLPAGHQNIPRKNTWEEYLIP
jgi:hypothetical protein